VNYRITSLYGDRFKYRLQIFNPTGESMAVIEFVKLDKLFEAIKASEEAFVETMDFMEKTKEGLN
jgi:hypothetical protein